jgi:hypothetical protein
VRGALEQSMDGHAERVVGRDELDPESLFLQQPLEAGSVEIYEMLWSVAQPESAHDASRHAAMVGCRYEHEPTRVKRVANSTKGVSHVGEMLDRLERGHDIPAIPIVQVIETAHGDVHVQVLTSPGRRGGGQLHPASLPALLARRHERETGAGTKLEERPRRSREAAEQGELALEIRSVELLVGEVVSVPDAAVAGKLKVVISAVDRAERVGGRDGVAPRETAGLALDDPPAMGIQDAVGAAAAEWALMGDLS